MHISKGIGYRRITDTKQSPTWAVFHCVKFYTQRRPKGLEGASDGCVGAPRGASANFGVSARPRPSLLPQRLGTRSASADHHKTAYSCSHRTGTMKTPASRRYQTA